MAAGLEYLTNYQSQYPSLSGFVSNITWRQCALKRIKSCRQPNNMPYPKWFLHPPASIFQPRLNWQDLLCCLLTPFPQSTGRARAARSERRGVWGGAPSPVPTATWSMGKPVPLPLSCQMAPGSCRETPLLSLPHPPLPSSLLSKLHLSRYKFHLNLGRPQFHPRDKSWDTGPKQRSASQAIFSAAFKRDLESQIYHFSFSLEQKKERYGRGLGEQILLILG